MNVKKGVKNIAYSIIGQVIAMVLGIIVPRLVIVSYGSEVNGLLSSVSQVVGYLSLLEAGVGAAALQALYKPISDKDADSMNGILAATHRYYRRTGALYFLFTLALSFVYPLVINTTLDYWFVALIVFICGVPNVINFFFQGKLKILLNAVGDNYVISNLNTITTTLATIAKILLLMSGANVIFVQAIYCVISLVQMIFIYAYVKKKYPWVNVKVDPNNEALSQKNSTLIHQLCSLVTNSTDVVVLSIFCNLKVASIYAVYNMIFNILYNLVESVNGGVTFIIGQAFCKGNEYYKKAIDAYEAFYLGLCSALMCVACILINPFLSLYTAGMDISYTDPFLPILFAGIHIASSIRLSSLNTITVAGHFKQTTKHAVVQTIINLVVSLILVNVMETLWGAGLYGVLIGTIAAFGYRCVVAIHYSNAKILGRNSLHSIKIILTNLLLIAVFLGVARFVDIEVENYFSWIFYAIPITATVVISFLALNAAVSPKSFVLIKNSVLNKIRNRRRKDK